MTITRSMIRLQRCLLPIASVACVLIPQRCRLPKPDRTPDWNSQARTGRLPRRRTGPDNLAGAEHRGFGQYRYSSTQG
jgi:hypothetical protein